MRDRFLHFVGFDPENLGQTVDFERQNTRHKKKYSVDKRPKNICASFSCTVSPVSTVVTGNAMMTEPGPYFTIQPFLIDFVVFATFTISRETFRVEVTFFRPFRTRKVC